MTIKGKTYDTFKWVTQILLPGLGTLYVGLAALWDVPSPQEVISAIVVIDACLGVLLGISQRNYQGDGTLAVLPKPDGGLTYSLELDGDPAELQNQKMVRFKVNKPKG